MFLYLSVFFCFRYLYLSFISYLRVLLLLPSIVYLYLYPLLLHLYLCICICICVATAVFALTALIESAEVSVFDCPLSHVPSICHSSHLSVCYVSNYVAEFVLRFCIFESWAFRIRIFICISISICISVYTVCIICILFCIYVSAFVSVSAFAVGSNIVVVALVTLVVVVVVTLPIDRWSVDRVGRNICNCQS